MESAPSNPLDLGFWLGVAVAIPLAVVANLLTPFVQRQWSKRSAAATTALRNKRIAKFEQVLRLHQDEKEFNAFQFATIIKITIVTAFGTAVSSIFGTIINYGGTLFFDSDVSQLLFSFINALNIVVSVMVINLSFGALEIQRATRNLAEYARRLGLNFDPETAKVS